MKECPRRGVSVRRDGRRALPDLHGVDDEPAQGGDQAGRDALPGGVESRLRPRSWTSCVPYLASRRARLPHQRLGRRERRGPRPAVARPVPSGPGRPCRSRAAGVPRAGRRGSRGAGRAARPTAARSAAGWRARPGRVPATGCGPAPAGGGRPEELLGGVLAGQWFGQTAGQFGRGDGRHRVAVAVSLGDEEGEQLVPGRPAAVDRRLRVASAYWANADRSRGTVRSSTVSRSTGVFAARASSSPMARRSPA
jgi:hypothetical protein